MGSPGLKDLVRNGIVDLSHLMSPGPFTVKYGSNSAAKKLQISKSGLFQSPNYPLPRPYKSMGGQFKTSLTQRGLISPNQTELYQRLHSPPSSHGNLAASRAELRRCKRMFPQVTTPVMIPILQDLKEASTKNEKCKKPKPHNPPQVASK